MTEDNQSTSSTEFDLVVLGATGFTGRQAAKWISEWAVSQRPELRWAVAGRNSDKLAKVAASLGVGPAPDVIQVDTSDKAGCAALAQRCAVLLTTVGPYARYGEHVIAGCAQAGTDYVDITGETPWVRQMIDKYDEVAQSTGAKIIPLCGFDSIPSDVGAYLICRALQAAQSQPTDVRALFSLKGGLNGGTLASALNMMELKQGRNLYHPHLLTPSDGREHLASKQPRDLQKPRFDEQLNSWITPFMMAPINTRVVRRTAAQLGIQGQGYGPEFRYSEAMRARSKWSAWQVASMLGVINGLGRSSVGRTMLKSFGPKPGQGPSAATMDGGFFRAKFWARGDDGQIARGQVSSSGDPGNRVTVNLLCTCATLLLTHRQELSERVGFLTPVSAFGDHLIDAMRALGMTVEASIDQGAG